MANASKSGSRKGPRSRQINCIEGRGDTVEMAVGNAVKRLDAAKRSRQPQVFDIQVRVLVGNPITDYIVHLVPVP